MNSVDGQALASTGFLMVSFNSNNYSGTVLSKNWCLCTALVASVCKICMQLAASHIQVVLKWPPVACNMNKINGSLPGTGATRVQFACDWLPLRYNLRATDCQQHAIFVCNFRPVAYQYYFCMRLTANRLQFVGGWPPDARYFSTIRQPVAYLHTYSYIK